MAPNRALRRGFQKLPPEVVVLIFGAPEKWGKIKISKNGKIIFMETTLSTSGTNFDFMTFPEMGGDQGLLF